jgi:folate-binding protein YgfZ
VRASASELLELDGGVADFPGWTLIEVTGAHRERFLQSQVSSDVVGLSDGASQLSALLDRTGRLQAFFFLRKTDESVELLVPEAAADRCVDAFEGNVIADDVAFTQKESPAMRLALGPAAVALGPASDRFPVGGWGSRGFVTWSGESLELSAIPHGELEARRVLGGPPAWGREARPGQLINETPLLDAAVSFDKGCYLGQETVAKLASHRGAARGPALLELETAPEEPAALLRKRLVVEGRQRSAEVLSVAEWTGGVWLLVALRRELRVPGRRVLAETEDGVVLRATVHEAPLLRTPTVEEMADRLTIAASAAFAEDRYDRSVTLLERAIAVCPAWADAYESMGVILGRLDRTEAAIRLMERLLELDPSSVMAHSNLSLFHNRLGDRERAEHHLALATRASLGGGAVDGEAERRREDEAREAGFRRREEMFRRVLEIDSDDPLAHFGLGELELERGHFAAALEHLGRAIEVDPKHAAARLALGAALEGLGESERARAAYREGVVVAAERGDLATAKKIQERLGALEGQAR